ncbi:MAG: hypothetical protein LBT53_06025 [Puniceicoccales bacterium]|jgi:hypothetical protein|nr:hypothetical protein [Puniceicoccales bacterium]
MPPSSKSLSLCAPTQSSEEPIKLSYKIRNWLVHDGYEIGGITMFLSKSIDCPFAFSEGAKKLIQESKDYKNNPPDDCLAPDAKSTWDDGDVLENLKLCHREIDNMFSSFLEWTIYSFIQQITLTSQK